MNDSMTMAGCRLLWGYTLTLDLNHLSTQVNRPRALRTKIHARSIQPFHPTHPRVALRLFALKQR